MDGETSIPEAGGRDGAKTLDELVRKMESEVRMLEKIRGYQIMPVQLYLEAHNAVSRKLNEINQLREQLAEDMREIPEKSSGVRSLEKNQGIDMERAKHPEYADQSARVGTFHGSPATHLPTPERLANAGFFYTGISDRVKCFYCGEGLHNWKGEDNPWILHARWFPDCGFIRQAERQEFIGRAKQLLRISNYSAEDTQGGSGMESEQNCLRTFTIWLRSNPTGFHHLDPGDDPFMQHKFCVMAESGYPGADILDEMTTTQRSPGMESEYNRLRTFTSWPRSNPIRPPDLAKAGFYNIGPGDRVQCTFCWGILRDWDPGDDPFVEHGKHFPLCPFIQHKDVGNIECSVVEVLKAVGEGISKATAKYPQYAEQMARTQSFADWPTMQRKSPEKLAEAGFFYTDVSDDVKCFYCDGRLHDWNIDDPWIDHAKCNPKCEFLMQVKGQAFIQAFSISDKVPTDIEEMRRIWREINQLAGAKSRQRRVDFTDQLITESDCLQSEKARLEWEIKSMLLQKEGMEFFLIQDQTEAERNALMEENEKLKEAKQCKVCVDSETDLVFLPCGHLSSYMAMLTAVNICLVWHGFMWGTFYALVSVFNRLAQPVEVF